MMIPRGPGIPTPNPSPSADGPAGTSRVSDPRTRRALERAASFSGRYRGRLGSISSWPNAWRNSATTRARSIRRRCSGDEDRSNTRCVMITLRWVDFPRRPPRVASIGRGRPPRPGLPAPRPGQPAARIQPPAVRLGHRRRSRPVPPRNLACPSPQPAGLVALPQGKGGTRPAVAPNRIAGRTAAGTATASPRSPGAGRMPPADRLAVELDRGT